MPSLTFLTTALLPLSLLLPSVSALKMSTYANAQRCTGAPIDSKVLTMPTGCNKRPSEGEAGIAFSIDENVEAEASYYVVYFSSDDCNPSTMLAKSDGGCGNQVAEGWKSWEVWDMCEGASGCEL